MNINNRRVEEIAVEAKEHERLELIQAKKDQTESEARLKRAEDAQKVKDYRSDHL